VLEFQIFALFERRIQLLYASISKMLLFEGDWIKLDYVETPPLKIDDRVPLLSEYKELLLLELLFP